MNRKQDIDNTTAHERGVNKMSRRKYDECCNTPYVSSYYGGNEGMKGFGLPILAVLILVLLQFGRGKCKEERDEDECDEDDYEDEKDCDDEKSRSRYHKEPIVDNGILFIIALFFLSCCTKKIC